MVGTTTVERATGEGQAGRETIRRVGLLSDDLSGKADEGTKKWTVAIAAALRGRHEVALLSARGPSAVPEVQVVPTGRSLIGKGLRDELRRWRPDVLVYASRSSATFASFLRARLLKLYCPGARVVLVGFQTRHHAAWQRAVIRLIAPDLVTVQSAANGAYLEELGCRVANLPSGVDLDTFRPIPRERRALLRAAYGLDPDRPIALHIGHLEPRRGIGVLADLAARGECQVVLVTSSTTAHHADQALGQALRQAGVTLLTDYQPRVEELYQLADCYVFPVQSTNNAIEAPLSVLEALACDLPVVTTRFGGLPRLFAGAAHPGLVFVDSPEELVNAASWLCQTPISGTRALVEPYGWERIADDLLRATCDTPQRSVVRTLLRAAHIL
ncbi:MAG: glycosyltransferase family 4 protein [Thermomicrobiales bacterium]